MRRLRSALSLAILCIAANRPAFVQTQASLTNIALTRSQLRALSTRCAPRVNPDTIIAIIAQESAAHPYALSINYPKREARRLGYDSGEYVLTRQPKDLYEAYAWTRWLIHDHHTVSIGLMQVNSQQAKMLHIQDLRALYDPCINIAAGGLLIQKSYDPRGKSMLSALSDAFALYNAGNIALGYQDGYANGVVSKAPPLTIHP